LLKDTTRLSEAEPLYRRALAIDEKSYGADHPTVAIDVNNLALLLQDTNRRSEAEPLLARAVRILSQFQRSTGHEHPNLRTVVENYRQLLTALKLGEPEVARRMKAAREGMDKLSPIVPEAERLLGPAKPLADVLAALDRQYKDQGKPAIFFLKPAEPIALYLDELLRPNGDEWNARGVAAYLKGAYADAIVFYDAALELTADQPAKLPTRLIVRMNGATALRELGQISQARDDLAKLLPELDQNPATESATKGRARFHLALCQWRLGDRAGAQKLAEASLAAYEGAPKSNPVDSVIHGQSEELLAALKAGNAPPPLAAVDAPAALEAARARYRVLEALTKLPLNEKAAPLLDQVLGPARSTQAVFDALDRAYREQGKPAVWFLPLNEPMAPHLDQLLGPAKTVNEVLESLDRQYRKQGRSAVWFLPLSEPISPHLDRLLGKVSR
jgi:tetratricopeptide (TPR) repeat protein